MFQLMEDLGWRARTCSKPHAVMNSTESTQDLLPRVITAVIYVLDELTGNLVKTPMIDFYRYTAWKPALGTSLVIGNLTVNLQHHTFIRGVIV